MKTGMTGLSHWTWDWFPSHSVHNNIHTILMYKFLLFCKKLNSIWKIKEGNKGSHEKTGLKKYQKYGKIKKGHILWPINFCLLQF